MSRSGTTRIVYRCAVTAAAAVLAAGAAAAPVGAMPQQGQQRAAGELFSFRLHEAASALTLAPEDRTGYVRTKFRHWVDEDSDGCDARKEVLIAESVEEVTVGPRCAISGGRWWSAYDARFLDSPSLIDIDHFVPLAEAWDSGASAWDAETRKRYANDLGDERLLIAVSASSNRSKSDQDPSTWVPSNADYRCAYTATWIAMKLRWDLSVDQAELDALAAQADACPDVEVVGTRAR